VNGLFGNAALAASCARANAASPDGDLPRSSPEAQGVASGGIREFLAAWSDSRAALGSEPHSFMLVRHGHVVAEGWWAPYRPRSIHLLHSLSKSFTCTAVGFAVAEGRLAVQDRVAGFFPELLPADAHEAVKSLRVRDLLTMSVGRAIETYADIMNQDDWVRAFLALPIEKPPGSYFDYDNWASFMLSAIIQRVSGESTARYLGPRLFEPLGMHDITWETAPHGINTGGWGLCATTETIAKLGQFYLQEGVWNHTRRLPLEWIVEATTIKIQQSATWGPGAAAGTPTDPTAALRALKASSDWYQGYCYQFWRCRHNAYRGDGAFGQFCLVMPDQDAVVAITSETADMQGLLNLVWDRLLPAMRRRSLPPDAAVASQLRRELADLSLPPPANASAAPIVAAPPLRRFRLAPNSLDAESAALEFQGRYCRFELVVAGKAYEIRCGFGSWALGMTDMPGTPPLAPWEDYKMRSRLPVKVAAACAWREADALQLVWRFYEKGNRDTVTCRFDGDRIEIEFLNSITPIMASHPETRPVLVGRRMS
jgi:CubicO group peptidase (beta-lactamase class C family)